MAAGGRCPRRRSWIRRRRGDSKLGGHGGGNDDPVLTPGGRSHCREWRCVRGHRIRLQGRMRVAANGDVYVPDSEDEESDMEVEVGSADVADSGGTTTAVDAVNVVAESIPADAVKVAAKGGDADGVKVAADAASADKMHPEVVARLDKLLPRIDPSFRDIFVNMLKRVHLPGEDGIELLGGDGLHLLEHGLQLLPHLVVLYLDQDGMDVSNLVAGACDVLI